MVDEHQRRAVGGQVFDAIANAYAIFAEHGRDLAREFKVFGEDLGLAHLAADLQDVVLALPARANADVFGRDIGEAAVQRHFGVFLFGVDFGVADEIEPAGGDQPAEPATPPGETLGLVKGGADVAGSGAEAERLALVVGGGDIEGASGQDRKTEARGVEDLDEVGAALEAFAQLGAARVHELADIADAVEQLASGKIASEEFGHYRAPGSGRGLHCKGHKIGRSPPVLNAAVQ